MTEFRRRKASNPVNPGQAFPIDAIERSRARKLLKAQRLVQKIEHMHKASEQPIDRPLLVELHTLLGSLEDREDRRLELGEPIREPNLFRQQYIPILQNLMRKTAAGTYDSEKAVLLFMYLANNLAKAYGVHANVGTRLALARQLRDEFEEQRRMGKFQEYIPKKYKGKELASERLMRLAPHLAQGREAHRGMQVTEYCPQCGRYLTKDDIP